MKRSSPMHIVIIGLAFLLVWKTITLTFSTSSPHLGLYTTPAPSSVSRIGSTEAVASIDDVLTEVERIHMRVLKEKADQSAALDLEESVLALRSLVHPDYRRTDDAQPVAYLSRAKLDEVLAVIERIQSLVVLQDVDSEIGYKIEKEVRKARALAHLHRVLHDKAAVVDNDSLAHSSSPRDAMHAFLAANVGGSDKGTPGHSYEIMYGPFLASLLHKKVNVLEIGVESGRSLQLWQRLFPNYNLIVGIGYGLGIEVKDVFKRNIADKHVLYTGSQADGAFLRRVKNDLGDVKFDLIIDDGSHVPWHQIYTLEHLFPDSLKDGGMYIIEDIETSYWDSPNASIYGYPIPNAGIGLRGSAIEKLKGIVDTLNRAMLLDPEYHVLEGGVDKLISHILFSQNAVIMWKKESRVWEAAEVDKFIKDYWFRDQMDPTRTHYEKWKSDNTWSVTGTEQQ